MQFYDMGISGSHVKFQYQKRSTLLNSCSYPCYVMNEVEASLPTLQSSEYYMEPCLKELANREAKEPGYCSRVKDFRVGRAGYGFVTFSGETDVRYLNLDHIVKFSKNEIIVYENENVKPAVGKGLNKPAAVTLTLHIRLVDSQEVQLGNIVKKMRQITERQGAHFISFDPSSREWRFMVDHFSRFGLSDEEEDIIMDDATAFQQSKDVDCDEVSDIDEETRKNIVGPLLSHSLPAHLGLDPVTMKEMKMLMFPLDEEDIDDCDEIILQKKQSSGKEHKRRQLQHSACNFSKRSSSPIMRRTPIALLEYNPGTHESSSGTIILAQQNRGSPWKTRKVEGFKLDLKHEAFISRTHSRNIVDAGLFMGRSFRVGWGPNGVLVHSGASVGSIATYCALSSVINLERVLIDKVVRDENNKLREELVYSCFDYPLSLHKEINHETEQVEIGPLRLKLQKLVVNRISLSEICSNFRAVVESQLKISGLSSATHIALTHQAIVWELIKVLFSDGELTGQLKSFSADNAEDAMHDMEGSLDVDLEALPLIRRAKFGYWLQESVCHRVEYDVASLNGPNDLEHIFLLLTGRELDGAVELAASKGDVRLACLLGQAGGSMVNRSDIARQLELWRTKGLEFKFIEDGRIRLLELLSGNISGASKDRKIDWKRFLGLVMWYQLPPDTPLQVIFQTYHQLLHDRNAPHPVPIYIDEGPSKDSALWSAHEHFDLSYYLMLLYAGEDCELKAMFSAFSSTSDPLDYHMVWHQRAVLEAVGAICSRDLHVLDMGFISQLLCLKQCHWAIYVALHMPQRHDFPYLQATLIKEILFQYCEIWSTQESQRKFIEELGIPSPWLHEALAVYFNYNGDLLKALEHFLECANWQKAHAIFMNSIAHSLFLSARDTEIWRLTCAMEDHRAEIEDWDLGAGIYISFYLLRSSLQEDCGTTGEPESLEGRNAACKDFFDQLNKSLAVWGSRLPTEARAVYFKMTEEISNLLLSSRDEGSTTEVLRSCYDTAVAGPVPEDVRSSYLHDAVSLFTEFLVETAT